MTSVENKENKPSGPTKHHPQKKKYLNQHGSFGATKTTVCQVDLVNESNTTEINIDLHGHKKLEEIFQLERTNTFEVVSGRQLHSAEESEMRGEVISPDKCNLDEMRGNVSITKSMIDYYHNYNHHFGRDDLMSLYKPNRQYIYVICKQLSFLSMYSWVLRELIGPC